MNQPRRMLVLRTLVEDYIRSQEPVGSTTLARRHNLGVSSATIRNDMSALEDEGYLVQPHTSAGRIPTEMGYRYFVDQLSTTVPLSPSRRRGIAAFLSESVSLQDALHRAARLLASITGQVAVVSSPALSKSRVRRIEVVPLAGSVLLAVIITDSGSVAQHTLRISSMPALEDIDLFVERINAECMNLFLMQAAVRIRKLAVSMSGHDMKALAQSLAQALEGMAKGEQAGDDLYMAGTSRLAHRQEIGDLAPLFDALERQVVLIHLMSGLSMEKDEVSVAIGSETHTPGLIHAAVVSSGYGESSIGTAADADIYDDGADVVPEQTAGSSPVAFIGSIGPTHMDYAATIAAVRAVAQYLTEFMKQDGGESDDSDSSVV